MPAHSEDQAKLMRLVKGIQSGDVKNAKEPAKSIAKNMKPNDVDDMTTMEEINKLKEFIRKTIREMNVTGNVQGYLTPKAFTKPGTEKKKAKKQADLTGYSVVNEMTQKEIFDALESTDKGDELELELRDKSKVKVKRIGVNSKKEPTFKVIQNGKEVGTASTLHIPYIKKIKTLNENRWLELKKEDTPVKSKIGKGISNINKQLNEMERFLNWYSRLKQENGMSNQDFWKRTNHNIYRIKERLIKLEQHIRKISE